MGADLEEQNVCGFEGFEKRLEVEFEQVEEEEAEEGGRHKNGGLRCLSRGELDNMLRSAECSIVSEQHNEYFDAYVLSESSLFVYPQRLILKTCGKTRLLSAVAVILGQAVSLGLRSRSCKYSRGAFIFPDAQPFPHTSFDDEVCVLDELFAAVILRGSRSAYVLEGDPGSGTGNWHIYTAMAAGEDSASHGNMKTDRAGNQCMTACTVQSCWSKYTLEMCMTHLHSSSASYFMNPSGTKSGADMTRQSGISSLLPNALISDFAFVPCGYSMNGLEDDALSTIHITPEEGHSYASFEIMGYDPASLDLQALINQVVACFKPGSLVMSMYASTAAASRNDDVQCGPMNMGNLWCSSQVAPQGYVCKSSVRQELVGNGVIAFHTFTKRSSLEEEFGVVPKALCLNANIAERSAVSAANEINHVQSRGEQVVIWSNDEGMEAKPRMSFREHNADGGFQQAYSQNRVCILS